MTWRTRIWTGISAAFVALVALALIHVSASLNPIRTASEFTDSIRAGISVSIPFKVLQSKSYQAERLDAGAFRRLTVFLRRGIGWRRPQRRDLG